MSNIDSKYIVISALVITSSDLVQSPQDTSTQLEIPLKEHTNRSQGGGGGRRREEEGGVAGQKRMDND